MKKIVVGISFLLISTMLFSSQLIAAAIYSQVGGHVFPGVSPFWSAFFEIGSWWLITITVLIGVGGFALINHVMNEKRGEFKPE